MPPQKWLFLCGGMPAIIGAMSYFAPTEPRPCWTCQYWGGWANEVNSWCARPGLSPVVGQPEYGCAFWTREPGSDDEPLSAMPAP